MQFNPYDYTNAAQQYCYSQNINPYDAVPQVSKPAVPQWVLIAQEMHKIRVMVSYMRQNGVTL